MFSKLLGGFKGVVLVLLAAAAVCGGLSYAIVSERGLNTELAGTLADLQEQGTKLEQINRDLAQALKDKDAQLEAANTTNYRADMVAMQDAFKEANQKVGQMLRERAEMENSNLLLDSRLKNTTKELTNTLEELKQARATLGGVESPYKSKLAQMAENLKRKEEEYLNLQNRLSEAERSLLAYQAEGKDYSQGAQMFQGRLEALDKDIAGLRAELVEKDRKLSEKDIEISELRQNLETARTEAEKQQAASAVAGVESQRAGLAQEITASNAQLLGQQEELKSVQQSLADLKEKLYQREAALAEKEREVTQSRSEMDRLKEEIAALRSGKDVVSKGAAEGTEVRRELDKKIRDLEKENDALQEKLSRAEKQPRGREKSDPFLDRNLRLLTEQLVKKEEEIRDLTTQLAALQNEKKAWEKSFGPREKRMAELEILVNTLTKQLGEYAGMIEKRDAELRANAERGSSLADELEAQKMAALALQKELAEARSRQEQTLQKLTQLMSMNTSGVGPDDMDFSLYGPATNFADPKAPGRQAGESPAQARQRAEKVKKQVEVLLESR